MEQPDELMTTAEVAALLRTPENTVRYWRSINVGPKNFRLPRHVVFDPLERDVNRTDSRPYRPISSGVRPRGVAQSEPGEGS